MASKEAVLKLLDGDWSKKRTAIQKAHATGIRLAAEKVKKLRKAAQEEIKATISALCKSKGWKVGSSFRASVGEDYGDVSASEAAFPALGAAAVDHKALLAEEAKELDAIDAKRDRLHREITLHGVTAEIVAMLEQL
jgi:hypothetical protein